jgi:hypothetical protein
MRFATTHSQNQEDNRKVKMRKMPFAAFEHNAAWLEISLTAKRLSSYPAVRTLTFPSRRADEAA